MSELPVGWTRTCLDQIASVKMGQAPDGATCNESGEGIPFFQGKAEFGPLYPTVRRYCTAPSKLAHDGDILLSIRAPVGPTNLAVLHCAIGRGLAAIRGLEGVDQKFLLYAIRNMEPWLQEQGTGTTFKAISGDFVRNLRLDLPPPFEQKRLAQKLDVLLAQVDTLKARIDAFPALLKSFRESALSAAVSGELTKDWRQHETQLETGQDVIDNDARAKLEFLRERPELKNKKSSLQCELDENYLFEIPKSWCFTSWGKISEWITYGFTRPMPKSRSGEKLLTAKDVQRFDLELKHCGFTTSDAFNALSEKDKPIKGDLLITKDGSIGRSALITTDEKFCINQSVAVCWLRSTTMDRRFLQFLANSDHTQRFVKDKAQGMAIQHLSIIDFAKCPVPVPPTEEQAEIVRRVEQLFAFADQLEARVSAAQKRIDALTQSLLAKAFRGELVPQDPNDEPASVLLERIRTQSAAAPKPRRGRKAAAN